MGSQGFQRQYKPNNRSVFFIKYPHLEQLNSEFFCLAINTSFYPQNRSLN